MKKGLFVLWIALSSCLMFGQQANEHYRFSKDVEASIEKDTVAWKYQVGAVQYSFIGDYKNVFTVWDRAVPARAYVPTAFDSAYLKKAKTLNARDYIIKRSKEEQVLIINEAHHDPKHRTFTKSLLEGLYKNGYRYLGLEAIADDSINQRKFAVKESGYYTVEPEFGNLIYEAKKIGFVIFNYEASKGKNGKEREIEQARNIERFMKANADGKYLIHCGFDHVYEKEVRTWEKAMAGRLKEYTNIDPFTVDQVKFSEKSKPEFGHYFLYATEEKQPFVLIKEDEVFNGIKDPKQTDVVVVHPITDYKNERPVWLSWDRKEYFFSKDQLKNQSYPIQILAYRANEYEMGGIPSDIIEMKTAQDYKPLYLKNGTYKIVIRNDKYEVKQGFDIVVK